MNIEDSTAGSARGVGVRRLARAALVAGAITLGASAFGHTAIANAEWDIERYDNCVAAGTIDEPECCILSGGTSGNEGVCVAPPARILQSRIQGVPLQPKLGQPGRAPVGVIGAQAAATNPG